jgi:hypothetical protein
MRRRLQHLKRSSEERDRKKRSAAKTKPPHDWKFGMRRYARDLAPHEACIRRAMHENPPAVNFTYRRFCRVFRDVFQAAVPGLPPAWPTDPPLSRSRHPHGHNLFSLPQRPSGPAIGFSNSIVELRGALTFSQRVRATDSYRAALFRV